MTFWHDLGKVNSQAVMRYARMRPSDSRSRCSVLAAAAIVLLMLTTCSGCGNGRIPVNGEVTINGKPVDGSIAFEPADRQGPTSGGKITDGKYDLVGDAAPLPGKKIVRILGVRKTGRKLPGGPMMPPGTMLDEIERNVPRTYNSESTLSCEISSGGSGKIDFELKSP